MPAKFQAIVEATATLTCLRLSGVIDEDNELGTLSEKIGNGTVVINASEVERINSCGVRDWVNWLGRAEKSGARVVLTECSPPIVAQINLVNNFTGQGVVKSFYAPYFCPKCEIEKAFLIETRDMPMAPPFRAPSCRCDECDGPMDFDDMEASYFAFLANPKQRSDSQTDKLLGELTPTGTGEYPRVPTGLGASAKTSGALGSLPAIPSLPSIRLAPPIEDGTRVEHPLGKRAAVPAVWWQSRWVWLALAGAVALVIGVLTTVAALW